MLLCYSVLSGMLLRGCKGKVARVFAGALLCSYNSILSCLMLFLQGLGKKIYRLSDFNRSSISLIRDKLVSQN